MDKETRARVSAAGGRARIESLGQAERTSLAVAGARAMHSPLGLGRRLAKMLPDLDDDTRAQLRELLVPLLADGGVQGLDVGNGQGHDELVDERPGSRPRKAGGDDVGKGWAGDAGEETALGAPLTPGGAATNHAINARD